MEFDGTNIWVANNDGKQRVNKTALTVWATTPNAPSTHPLSRGY